MSEPEQAAPGLVRRLVYSAILVLLFFAALEGVLALAGIRPGWIADDPYVGFEGRIPLFVEQEWTGGSRRMVTADNKLRFFNAQSFADPKPDGVYRIFCLGGSTTYGRPFNDLTSFSGWLREIVGEAAPGQTVEVINAGGISYASYRVAAVMEEACAFQPDLFIVYTGHNEFLEDRTYAAVRDASPLVRKARGLAGRTRTFSALRAMLRDRAAPGTGLKAEVTTRLDRSIGPDAYERDDAWREDVLRHFERNLERMHALARSADAELVLVNPASSLKDCRPFKSVSDASLPDAEWKMLQAHAASGSREGLAHALRIDPRDAALQYRYGELLLAAGEHEAAQSAFVQARDEDIVPLRAQSRIQHAVKETASRLDIPLLDFAEALERAVERQKGHRIPGAEWFLDHVHPSPEGHLLLARSLYELLRAEGWVDGAVLAPDLVQGIRERVDAQRDARYEGVGLRNLAKVLSWAGKTGEAARSAEAAVERLGEDAECLFILGLHEADREQWDRAEMLYRRTLAADPEFTKALVNLSILLVRKGAVEEALEGYGKAEALNPDHPGLDYNMARALARAGRLDDAVARYRSAIDRDPTDADACFNLGGILAEQGKIPLARDAYARVLKLNPDDTEARELIRRLDERAP